MDQFNIYAKKVVKHLNDAAVVALVSHLNVRGENYYGSHLLFGRIYESLHESFDTLVEKLNTLGYNVCFDDLSGPGITVSNYGHEALTELTLGYVMSLLASLTLFFNYASSYSDNPGMVALADELQSLSSSVLQLQGFLQRAKGY